MYSPTQIEMSSEPDMPVSPQSQAFKINKMKLDIKSSDDDRAKKRQVRLLKNRQSAALSRNRKKEYVSNLESKAHELKMSSQELHMAFTQLSANQYETRVRLELLEKQLGTIRLENENLAMKIDHVKSKIHTKQNKIDLKSSISFEYHSNNNSNNNNINNNNNNELSSGTSSPIQSESIIGDKVKREREILIGINKYNNSKSNSNINLNSNNNQSKQQSCNNSQTVDKEEVSYHSPQYSFNSLSISNPNVNSSPVYLTRARSSSYHPQSNSFLQTSSTNTTPNTNDESISTPDSSPLLPSLHHITKNLHPTISPATSSPSSSSPLASLSPLMINNNNISGSPHRSNMIGLSKLGKSNLSSSPQLPLIHLQQISSTPSSPLSHF
ncbi:hypothetical protein CYY_004551 [Polysphondylium violaceum]|uniref:BZIP domain-containing protein n=1 Tax=Polysphondylium violaceum TaxID=133409 RepID=A0A8J4PT73_9MYCE|nr:hypothetical protein CYY_004551 [Polysphondylium violaceum]